MNHSNASTKSSLFSKIIKYHDLIPLFFFLLMVIGLLVYFDPTASSIPEWRIILGKKLLVPYANLGLLLYIILYYAVPPLNDYLRERRQTIEEGIKDFEQRSDNVALQYKEIKEKLSHVDEEVEQIIARAKALAEEEKQKSIEQSRQAAARLKKDAENLLQQEYHQMENEMRQELLNKAFAEVDEILKGHLTEEDQKRFQEDFLSDVERGA